MIETLSSIEPLLFEDEIPRRLADLVCRLQQEVSRLERGLQADALREIADLARHANADCGNPIDRRGTRLDTSEEPLNASERAGAGASSAAEAQAEMVVLRAIDEAHAAGSLSSPTSIAFLTWAHRSFYQALAGLERPASDQGSARMAPGRLREGFGEVGVSGTPIPQAPERIGAFLAHFERRFGAAERWQSARIIAVAAAHHRLDLIRPFPYGNGRVSRLMSHAMVMRAGIGAGGLWSLSRGLARKHDDYHRMMRHAGSRRTGDRDGRGQLSAAALQAFSEWMLSVMLEEVRAARASFAFEALEPRYRRLLRALDYDDNAQDLAGAVLRFGQIDRGDACVVLKTSERTARNAVSCLVQGGFLKSSTPKGPVRIAFPIAHRDQLFPQVFAASPVDPLSPTRSPIGPTDTSAPARHLGFCDSAARDKGTSPC